MSKLKFLCILPTLSIMFLNIGNVLAQENSKQGLKEYASYVADYYNINEKKFFAVIECESKWDQKADNPRSTASGIMQFLDGSFKWFASMYEDEKGIKLSKNSARDQIRLAGFAWSKGYEEHWECYK